MFLKHRFKNSWLLLGWALETELVQRSVNDRNGYRSTISGRLSATTDSLSTFVIGELLLSNVQISYKTWSKSRTISSINRLRRSLLKKGAGTPQKSIFVLVPVYVTTGSTTRVILDFRLCAIKAFVYNIRIKHRSLHATVEPEQFNYLHYLIKLCAASNGIFFKRVETHDGMPL